jgi:hypothetical protein
MINPYCKSLEGFFSEMVYYGLLKADDAQCFKTDVQVKPSFYILFVGAILLALINSFVMKAVTQHFRDQTTYSQQNIQNEKVASDIGDNDWNEVQDIGKIRPVPVLFTDQYRWLLRREDTLNSSQQYSESIHNSDHDHNDPYYADSAKDSEIDIQSCSSTVDRNYMRPDEQSFDDASVYTNTNNPK